MRGSRHLKGVSPRKYTKSLPFPREEKGVIPYHLTYNACADAASVSSLIAMARSLRIERAGGVYHLINRGNYRGDVFVNDGAHLSFEKCLFEACEKCGWILEGSAC